MDNQKEEPLGAEAAKRREWRGDESEAARPEPRGHSLPASEDEDERMKGGRGDKGASGGLGTILPPH